MDSLESDDFEDLTANEDDENGGGRSDGGRWVSVLLTVSAGAFILFVSDDPDGDLVRHGEVATCGKDRGGPSLRLEVETEDFLCVVLKFSLK